MESQEQNNFSLQKKCAEKYFEVSGHTIFPSEEPYYEEMEWESEPERISKIQIENNAGISIYPETNSYIKKGLKVFPNEDELEYSSCSDEEIKRLKAEMEESGLVKPENNPNLDYDEEGITKIKKLRMIKGPANYLHDLNRRPKPTLNIITDEKGNSIARPSYNRTMEYAKPIALRRKPHSIEDQNSIPNEHVIPPKHCIVPKRNDFLKSPNFDEFSPDTYLKLSGPGNEVLDNTQSRCKTPKKNPGKEIDENQETPKKSYEKCISPFGNSSEEELNYDSRFISAQIDPYLAHLDEMIEKNCVAMPDEKETLENERVLREDEVNAFIEEYFENGDYQRVKKEESQTSKHKTPYQPDFSNTKSTLSATPFEASPKEFQKTAIEHCIPKLLEYQNTGMFEAESSPLRPVNPLQEEESQDEKEEENEDNQESSSTIKQLHQEIEEKFCIRNREISRNYIVADVFKWTNTKFPWDEDIEIERKLRFGLQAFRPNQKGIINAVLCNRDVFVCMPTGGGKSLIFQIAAMVGQGITFVIQPLLALIQDQICHLKYSGVNAVSLTSSIPKDEQRNILFDLEFGEYPPKIVYITPEKVCKSSIFVNTLNRLYEAKKIDRFVVDEVHCVSQWGKDFRPDYMELKCLRENFSSVPIIGLTATATEKVKHDVISTLGLKTCLYFQSSFNRANLIYEVWDKPSKLEKTIKTISDFIKKTYPGKCGIIYCCSKKDCEEVAQNLRNFDIKAKPYHSGMGETVRYKTQEEWMKDEIQVVVATIAFGMGIDKADVRFVIHYTFSKSLENYYQESGRAGRDGFTSHCIVLYSFSDRISIYSLIKKSDSKSVTTNHVIKMIKYCEDKTICRRAIILAYLGEKISAKECRKTCDNCANKVTVKSYEALNEAKMALEFIQKLSDLNYKITMLQLVECFRGKFEFKFNPKKIDLTTLKNYGFLKNLSRENIERLLRTMFLEEVISEKLHENYAKHVSAYVIPNVRRDLRIENLKVVFKATRYSKIEENYTPTAPLEPEVIAKRWHKDFGFCLPDQFDVLLYKLKRTRVALFNQEKEEGGSVATIDSFIPMSTLISLCKWLPIGFQDHHAEKIYGLSPRFLRKYGEIFFDQIFVFVSKEGIKKEEFKGVPDSEEVPDQVFEYQKHLINNNCKEMIFEDMREWTPHDVGYNSDNEDIPIFKRIKVN